MLRLSSSLESEAVVVVGGIPVGNEITITRQSIFIHSNQPASASAKQRESTNNTLRVKKKRHATDSQQNWARLDTCRHKHMPAAAHTRPKAQNGRRRDLHVQRETAFFREHTQTHPRGLHPSKRVMFMLHEGVYRRGCATT
uniref:Uncharacterized protein n=1 Tax=Eutreptiella gymnastica TaxID=73025 RepID=A0A7S4LQ78_9EUGL